MQNTMSLELSFHTDAGHGWLEVPRKVARAVLGDKYQLISRYSYQNHVNVYLEEDSDATLFFEACRINGVCYKLAEKYCDPSPIRLYAGFVH